jgi:hypothetical protein
MFNNTRFKFIFTASHADWSIAVALTNSGVLLSTLLQDILHPSHHLLNVLLQSANKMDLSNKKKKPLLVTEQFLHVHPKSTSFSSETKNMGTEKDTKYTTTIQANLLISS